MGVQAAAEGVDRGGRMKPESMGMIDVLNLGKLKFDDKSFVIISK